MNALNLSLIFFAGLSVVVYAPTADACEEHYDEYDEYDDAPRTALVPPSEPEPPAEVAPTLAETPEAPAMRHIRWVVADEAAEYASMSAGLLEIEMARVVETVRQYELEFTYLADGQSATVHIISQFGQEVVKSPLPRQGFRTNEIAVRMRAVVWDAEPSPWTRAVVVTGVSLTAPRAANGAGHPPAFLMTGCDAMGHGPQGLGLFGLILVIGLGRRQRTRRG